MILTMSRSKRKKILTTALLCVLASSALAAGGGQAKKANNQGSSVQVAPSRRVHLGQVTLGGFYSHYSGPYYGYYPGYYPRFWSPLHYYYWPYYDPFPAIYYPGYFTGFSSPQRGGQVKLKTKPKTAEVFLNGAYAGAAKDYKGFWLEPGAYDLEIRSEDFLPFRQRIYMLSGKTLKIKAALIPK